MNADRVAKSIVCTSTIMEVLLACIHVRSQAVCHSHPFHVILLYPAQLRLHVLAQPSYAFTIALSQHNTAHEDLNGSDALEWHLTLASCLIQAEHISKLLLADGLWMINLVAQNQEWRLAQLFHCQQSIKLGLGLWESLVILCINKEDNA